MTNTITTTINRLIHSSLPSHIFSITTPPNQQTNKPTNLQTLIFPVVKLPVTAFPSSKIIIMIRHVSPRHLLICALVCLIYVSTLSSAFVDIPKDTTCNAQHKCIEPLLCESSKCVIRAEYSCIREGTPCKKGLWCVGPAGAKLCMMPMTLGQACGIEPYWLCTKELTCRLQVCIKLLNLGETGPCLDANSNKTCADDLSCHSLEDPTKPDVGQCVKVIEQPGEYCNEEQAVVCKDGLVCESNICKIDEHEDCKNYNHLCKSNTQCIGNNIDGKACKQYIPLGGTCGLNPFQLCLPSLICDHQDNICKLKEHDNCNHAPTNCVTGTQCVGTSNLKQCKKPINVGKPCDNAFKICQSQLTCQDDICKHPKDQDCNDASSVCVTGTECVGNSGQKKCKPLIPVGDACNMNDPLSVCEGGNNVICENSICKVKDGKSCDEYANPTCVDGSNCVGQDSNNKRCEQPVTVGKPCSANFKICQQQLTCQDDICKHPKDQDCNDASSVCVTGTQCVGNDGQKKCKPLIPVGDACNMHDPLSVCEGANNVICENNICKVKQGQSCDEFTNAVCVDGTYCVGNNANDKRCRKSIGPGKSCDTNFNICRDDLTCENNICKINEDQKCSSHPNQCIHGLICVGTGSAKRCKHPVPLNGACGPNLPFAVCDEKENLVCDTDQNLCKKDLTTPCLDSNQCISGSKCVGSSADSKQCHNPIGIGGACNKNQYQACETDLLCEDYKCKIKEFGECDKYEHLCQKSTVCVGPEHEKMCRTLLDVGEKCDNVFEKCLPHLTCEDGICKVPLYGQCQKDDNECIKGLKCVGSDKNKKCVLPISVGKPCQTNSNVFSVCEDGLTCQTICRLPIGSPCKDTPNACLLGSKCVGKANHKKCQVPVGVNGQCDVNEECEPKLICDSHTNKCKRELLAKCIVGECKTGTRCVQINDENICVKRIGEGEQCGNKKLGVCDIDFICLRRKCINRTAIPKWFPCSVAGVSGLECDDGLSCLGRSTSKYCVKPIGEGGNCKTTNPFLSCAKGLTCVASFPSALWGGICKKH